MESPDKPPRLESPDKPKSPVKSKALDSSKTDKPPDSTGETIDSDRSGDENTKTLGDKLRETMTDNNRNPVEDLGNTKQEIHTTGHDNNVPPLQGEGELEDRELDDSGAVIGNSTGEPQS